MNRIVFLLIALVLFSCDEEKINKELMTVDSDLLVVEGVLTNEKKNHKIKLSHPHQTLNGNDEPVSGAVVTIIEGNEKVYEATEVPAGSGNYFTEEMTAVFGKLYVLYIQNDGKDYFAVAGSVPVEPMGEFQYYKVGDDLYSLQFADSGESPNYVDYYISWANTPSCQTEDLCEGRLVYYDLKTIDVNSLFKPDKEDFLFPANSIVVRRKYSVSNGYKTFLRSVLSETEWRGGVFDVQRENVPTNLSAGATGYFAVSTVLSDTTIIAEKP
ncbi:MAG: DUF4249 family protein [Cyclobacteriaceae bacterium]